MPAHQYRWHRTDQTLLDDREVSPIACADRMCAIAARHRVFEQQRRKALAGEWWSCVDRRLAGGGLSREEEVRLGVLLAGFGFAGRASTLAIFGSSL